MATTFMGKDGFIWWHGVVENRLDPLMIGRCKVRILGWHTHDKGDMPTDSLPWAYPLMPLTSASQTEVGYSPTGPVEGTWVLGFFRDGEAGQEPVMMGTLGGIPEPRDPEATKNIGFNDPRLDVVPTNIDWTVWNYITTPPSRIRVEPPTPDLQGVPYKPKSVKLEPGEAAQIQEYDSGTRATYPRFGNAPTTSKYARGVSDSSTKVVPPDVTVSNRSLASGSIIADKNDKAASNFSQLQGAAAPPLMNRPLTSFGEPLSSYKAQYPYNHVFESESGHLIEIDDTPHHERLHWYHRSGTFTEIGPKGTRVDRVHDDKYDMIWKNHRMKVGGSSVTNIGGDYENRINGSSIIHAGGSSSFFIDNGNYDINVKGGGFILTAAVPNSVPDFGRDSIAGEMKSGDITIQANGKLILKGTKILITDDEQERVVDGNMTETVKGKAGYAAGSMGLSSQSEFGIFSGANYALTVGGAASETIINPFVFLGNLNAKKTTSVLGKQVMECTDLLLTGGINFNMGPSGLLSSIKMNPFAAGGSVDITTLGPLGINLEAKFPAAIAKFKSGLMLDMEAKIVRIVSSLLVQVGVDAKLVQVGGSTDFAVLASQLATLFAAHTHLTANGPSSPPDNAASVSSFFSKKVTLG